MTWGEQLHRNQLSFPDQLRNCRASIADLVQQIKDREVGAKWMEVANNEASVSWSAAV
jgi:hypothetical protein